ncbi:MAG: PHB depolymerase family esterase [Myxococcota bacterium]
MRSFRIAFSSLLFTLFLPVGAAHALEEVTGFGTNPGNLVMYQHIPTSPRSPMPLVLVLHGCTQQGPAYATGTGWVDLADELGVGLVVAEQKTANNQNRCFNWFEDGDITRGQGEALSLMQMVDHVRGNTTVDDNAIFVTGLSAGGAMTAVMLATYPDVFAAGAVIAGVPYRCGVGLTDALGCMNGPKANTAAQWGDKVRNASSHSGPWPRVSIWHGDADTTVQVVNADEAAQQWTNVHGLSTQPTEQVTVARDATMRWRDANNTVLVERHTIDNMQHGTPVNPGSTPESCGTAGAYILDVDICSTREIARFFGLLDAPTQDAGAPVLDAGGAADAAVSPDAAVGAPDAGNTVTDAGVTPVGAAETFSDADGYDLTGWMRDPQFTLVTDDHTGSVGSGAIQGEVLSPESGCQVGVVSASFSRVFTLGSAPTLRYARMLELLAAININTYAELRVTVSGENVDGEQAMFEDITENTWNERVVDLAAYANQTVTLAFELEAYSTVCLQAEARVTLDDIVVGSAVTPEEDAGTPGPTDAGGPGDVDAGSVDATAPRTDGGVITPQDDAGTQGADAAVGDDAGTQGGDAAVGADAGRSGGDGGALTINDDDAGTANADEAAGCGCSVNAGASELRGAVWAVVALWMLRRRRR